MSKRIENTERGRKIIIQKSSSLKEVEEFLRQNKDELFPPSDGKTPFNLNTQ